MSERRVEDLWARGGNWVGRESLGEWGGREEGGEEKAVGGRGKAKEKVEDGKEGIGGEGDRVGWKCKCGREYWVRVVKFAEGERGCEDLERGGKSLGVSAWEMVDKREKYRLPGSGCYMVDSREGLVLGDGALDFSDLRTVKLRLLHACAP